MDKLSYRVMRTNEFPDQQSVFYRISCDCDDAEHDMMIEFEFDRGIMEIFLYKTFYWKHYYAWCHWYEKIWKRISASARILFGGYIEMQGDLLIVEEEHIDAFIEALQEGKGKLKKWKEGASNGQTLP